MIVLPSSLIAAAKRYGNSSPSHQRENGVERLENRIGKPLTDLTRAEADEWIDRLTPEGRE